MDDTLVIYLIEKVVSGGNGTQLALMLVGITLTYLLVNLLKSKIHIDGKYSIFLTIVVALLVSLLLVPLSSPRTFFLAYLIVVIGSNYVHTIYAHFIKRVEVEEEEGEGGRRNEQQ